MFPLGTMHMVQCMVISRSHSGFDFSVLNMVHSQYAQSALHLVGMGGPFCQDLVDTTKWSLCIFLAWHNGWLYQILILIFTFEGSKSLINNMHKQDYSQCG